MARGVWERIPGSGIWWIHYIDAEGKRRREKVGRKGDAIRLYHQRKADALAGRKLGKPLRQRERTFQELDDNALEYARKHKANPVDDQQKIGILVEEFGGRPAASLTQQELAAFLESRNTSPATFNRYRATLSMIYRGPSAMGGQSAILLGLFKQRRNRTDAFASSLRKRRSAYAGRLGKNIQSGV